MSEIIKAENAEARILKIRGQRVILSQDLAILYGVSVKALNQAVKRNVERFPPDFMFQLSVYEFKNLKSQFVTSSWGGLRRAVPYAFSEHGVAMLSAVLRSKEAVRVSLAIIRAFIKLRHALGTHQDLARRVEKVEGKVDLLGTDIRLIREDLRDLKETPRKDGPKVRGFQIVS